MSANNGNGDRIFLDAPYVVLVEGGADIIDGGQPGRDGARGATGPAGAGLNASATVASISGTAAVGSSPSYSRGDHAHAVTFPYVRAIGTAATQALAGDTPLLHIGASATQALVGNAGLDNLSDVVVTSPQSRHILQHTGTDWRNVPRPFGARHGFENRTDSTLAMSGATLQITTAASYGVWVDGARINNTTTLQASIANNNTMHYIAYNAAGALAVGTTEWDIEARTVTPACTVYRTGTSYAVHDERHGHERISLPWHKWAHDTIGARYEYGLTGVFTNTTLSIAQGSLHDEDIDIDTGGTKTTCRVWYRNAGGASMTFDAVGTLPYKAITGALQWDNAGTLTPIGVAKFANSWVYVTNDMTAPIYVVTGQAEYANAAAANNATLPALPGLTTREWKLIYRVVYKNQGGNPTYDSAVDYRETNTGPASSTTTNSHAALSDRSLDSQHPASAITAATAGNGPYLSDSAVTVQIALNELGNHSHAASYQPIVTAYRHLGNLTGAVAATLYHESLHAATVTGNITGWTINGLSDGERAAIRLTNPSYSVSATGLSPWPGTSAALSNIAVNGIILGVLRTGASNLSIC